MFVLEIQHIDVLFNLQFKRQINQYNIGRIHADTFVMLTNFMSWMISNILMKIRNVERTLRTEMSMVTRLDEINAI